MELELRQDYISCWDNGYRTTMNQEETTEMIVPDACPDILQVLDGEGKLLLQRKEAMDGRAEFSGCIKVTVLYQPDADSDVCSMETILPLSCALDSPALTRRSKLMVNPQIQKVDVHSLNPRKVLIKTNFTLDVSCYTPQSITISPNVENSETYAIEQKIAEYQTYVPVAAMEKMFNYSDVLNLPAGRPDMKELLRTRADCVCNESKVIGNKVVFKGEAKLDLLYRSPDHKLCTANFQLPFSQIMENSELSEEATPDLRIIFTDVSCKPADGEGRNVAVELELLAQCVLRKQENSPVLTDLYSTKYDAVPVFKPLPISRLMDQGVAPETVREVLESGMPVENIMDVQIRPMQMNTVKQGNEMAMNAEVEAFVLFKNDQGGMGSLHRRMIIIHQIPIANHWNYQCEFWISRGGTATPVSGGVEIAFTIEYSWNAMENGAVEVIERASLEDKKPTTKESPSVIIRSVRSGESLWEIAKAYGTTVAEIVEVNSLLTTEIYPGQMLMIPRVKERMMA